MEHVRNTWAVVILGGVMAAGVVGGETRTAVLYSTDLFHPHADPDDHYDLACLFALGELDLRGIVLDLGAVQAERPGSPAVEQMMSIARRRVPYALGLSRPLRSRTDTALDEPAQFQGGVELMLSVLRRAREKVVVFTTGSCRDVAVAFNREPALLKEKVKAVYFNVGRGPGEPQDECNVGYDPGAYLRLFESGLPLYWCPCFGKNGYETFYVADQAEVLSACTQPVRNYFVYCLTRSKAEALPFLSSGPHPVPTGPRRMWCTAPMLHAAGRKIYQRGPNDFVALTDEEAGRAGLAGKSIEVFRFEPICAQVLDPTSEAVEPTAPEPGRLTASYRGRLEDRVGTHAAQPDGRHDCCVRVLGVPADKSIRNIVLTGPQQGRWEHAATDRWWRVAYQRGPQRLDVWFQFYAPGEHRVEILYADGTAQAATFTVPDVAAAGLHVKLDPAVPNGWVFRAIDPRYPQILASCLKNLLANLGR